MAPLLESLAGRLRSVPPKGLLAAAVLTWFAGYRYSNFDRMYMIITVFALILGPGLQRGGSTGRFSAYSVFNPGQRHLLGDLRAEQVEAEQRGDAFLARQRGDAGLLGLGEALGAGDEGDGVAEDAPALKSRDANRPCSCGSGKKTKKCCGAVLRARTSGAAEYEEAGSRRGRAAEAVPMDPEYERWRREMQVIASGSKQRS